MLSLTEEGTGILKTHVTRELVEEALQHNFNTKARFGDDWTATYISEGKGFISIIGLIEPKWTEDADRLPEKFILKMPTCVKCREMARSMKEHTAEDEARFLAKWQVYVKTIHNAECEFYDYLKGAGVPAKELHIPEIYGHREFAGDDDVYGFMLMEYLDRALTKNLTDCVAPEKAEQALKAWARLQAHTYTDEFLKLKCFEENNYRKVYAEMMESKNLIDMFKSLEEPYPELQELIDEALAVKDEVYDLERLDTEPERWGIKPLLAHGDMWSANILWNTAGEDLKALIDFQLIHLSAPGGDLARFFITIIEKDLMEKYYAAFREALGHDREMPFTLEKLKSNYYSVYPFNALVNIAMFGPIANYVATKIPDPKAREKNRAVCSEKVKAMLEDMLEHHKNRK
ncbi:unnamed protein product, partial [Mesorhabditis spiculigera]